MTKSTNSNLELTSCLLKHCKPIPAGFSLCRDARTGGGGQGGQWPPQYFADQLTLFEPGRADYPPHYYWPPPPLQCFSLSGITAV